MENFARMKNEIDGEDGDRKGTARWTCLGKSVFCYSISDESREENEAYELIVLRIKT